MKKNTSQLWDEFWKNTDPIEEDILKLAMEENSIRWQRIEKIVLKKFGSFENLEVIEIGAGSGTNAALMAKRGAQITILDYSEKALVRARELFERNNLSAEFIKQNALSLPSDLLNKYDISMSFGLAEHFRGDERIKINKAHFDILKKGGITFISVPNKYNFPYRIFKFIAECTDRWEVGEEYPYSRKEFRDICKQIGITKYSFSGDSLFSSFSFIKQIKTILLNDITRKVLKMVRGGWRVQRYIDRHKSRFNRNSSIFNKKEKGTFLDQYLSYALVVYGTK